MTLQSGTIRQSPSSVFFSYGFRTFFLTAGLYAVIVMIPWLIWIGAAIMGGAVWVLPTGEAAQLWHAHEMIFGFAAAAVAGFLLTAVPSWTGAAPLQGRPLVLLFCVWLLGRGAMWLSGLLPPAVVALCDLPFVPMSAAIAFWQLFQRPSMRNALFLSLLAALFAGNLIYHFERLELAGALTAFHGLRLGLDAIVVMVVILGGRIVPAFTHNAVNQLTPGDWRVPMRR